MSDLRVSRGNTTYTGNSYTVPTAPLTASSNTQLLLRTSIGTHGTLGVGQLQCGANTIVDVSQNNYNLAVLGNVTAIDKSPYSNQSMCGSLYLTNNTSYMLYNANTRPNLNANIWSQDSTLECWVNPTYFSTTANTFNVFGRVTAFTTTSIDWQVNVLSNGRPQFYWIAPSTAQTGNASLVANVFNHVAVTHVNAAL
ncbi:TPA: hypothetical protein ACH3X2_000280 [Trebouxia sp. C0005]